MPEERIKQPKSSNMSSSASMAIQKLNTLNSPFFNKLPAEIRNTIYRAAITPNGGLKITKNEIRTHTTLLKVSARIRQEAQKIFYAENTFLVTVDSVKESVGLDWLSRISKDHASWLSRVVFSFENSAVSTEVKDSFDNAVQALEKFGILSNMENIGIYAAILAARKVLSLAIPKTSIDVARAKNPKLDVTALNGDVLHHYCLERMQVNFLNVLQDDELAHAIVESRSSIFHESYP